MHQAGIVLELVEIELVAIFMKTKRVSNSYCFSCTEILMILTYSTTFVPFQYCIVTNLKRKISMCPFNDKV